MQPEQPYQSGSAAADARDSHTFQVADHGIDPVPMPERPSAGGSGSDAGNASDAGARRSARRGARNARNAKNNETFGLRDFLVWCGVPVLIVLVLRIFVLPLYYIPSSSMMDTIHPNDRVVTLSTNIRPTSKLQRGDIIVFKDPANWLGEENASGSGGYLIKRLIGLPGDTVACAGPGQPVTVNGVAIDETSYIRPGSNPSAMAFSVTVTPSHVFVLGDNRAHSADSRFHQDDGDNGLVPMSDVSGTAVLTYWPLNRIGLLDAHHEVFDNVPSRSASNAVSQTASQTSQTAQSSQAAQSSQTLPLETAR